MSLNRVRKALGQTMQGTTVMIVLVLLVSVLFGLIEASGSSGAVKLIWLLLFVILYIPIVGKYGLKSLLWLAVFLYWVPFPLPGLSSLMLDSPSELLIYLLGGFAFLDAGRRSKLGGSLPFRYIFRIENLVMLAYVGAGLLSLALHPLSMFALYRFRIAFLYPVVVVVVCRYMLRNFKDVQDVIRLFLLSTCLFSLFLLIGFLTKSFEVRPDSLGGERLSAIVYLPGGGFLSVGEAIMASNAAVVFPLALVAWLYGKTLAWRVGGMLSVATLGLVLIYTQGRGGWIGAACAAIVVLLLSLRRQGIAFWGTLAKIVVVLAASYLVIMTVAYARGATNSIYLERTQTLFSNPLSDQNFNGRLELIQYYWHLLLRYPWGVGWDATYDVYYTGALPYPHNAFLLMGRVSGWLGMISYIGVLACLAMNFFRAYLSNHKGQIWMLAGLGALTAWVVTGMAATTGIYDFYGAGMVWWSVAILLAATKIAEKRADVR